ncbi:MAG: hypothetical protein WAK75_05010 [Methanoregula sp.]|uniref:hypothetical protein n=1 Tax=Methanoregula sp. TaxID=2052170 RepID=UPI003BB0FFEE
MTSPHRDHALTELYTFLLIVLLICIAVIIIMSVSTGFVTSLLQKPPTFAVRAAITTPYAGKNVICLYHGAGDPVALSSLSASGYSRGIFFTLESPDGTKIAVSPSPTMTGNPWESGGTAIIYYDGSRFWVTDNYTFPAAKNGSVGIADMPPGIWVIYITDQQTQVVVNSLAVTA